MEFEQVLELRRSTRKYAAAPIPEEIIEKILQAANCAPVGSRMYEDVHITIVQDQALLRKLCEAAWVRFSSKETLKKIAGRTELEDTPKQHNLFYDAPVVFFVSHRKQTLQPGIQWANATSIVNQMHLQATALGLGSCYMWGALESMRMLPEFDHTDLLQLPEDFELLCGLAVGYPAQPLQARPYTQKITVNRI